uniref:Lysophospholipid acyltransferase 7 n=1 Tax=Photinus pyralis TaxID=7054 RepID=A0A1Y1N572_PHOPY
MSKAKKWIGSALGLLMIFSVSGYHIWHSICTFLINAAIILLVPQSHCHLVSFGFSFLYLLFFRTTIYFGIPYPPAHTNMIQMILTLKLAGLGFEVNTAYLNRKKGSPEESSGEDDATFFDVFHYTFNYIGLLTGPYYRFRTFKDFFNRPFGNYAACNEETMKKLALVPLFVLIFLGATHFWPLAYAQSDAFYTDHSWLYRLWYTWPTFLIFRMRLYIAMTLSECICTMAGLGAYPQLCAAKPGQGPTENLKEMDAIASNPDRRKTEQYDFETIHNINPYESDFCTTFRNGIKNWNICIQYWFAFNIYKRFPNKKTENRCDNGIISVLARSIHRSLCVHRFGRVLSRHRGRLHQIIFKGEFGEVIKNMGVDNMVLKNASFFLFVNGICLALSAKHSQVLCVMLLRRVYQRCDNVWGRFPAIDEQTKRQG